VKSLPEARLLLKSLRDGDVDEDALGELLEIDREPGGCLSATIRWSRRR
jgi:hypothetical protein